MTERPARIASGRRTGTSSPIRMHASSATLQRPNSSRTWIASSRTIERRCSGDVAGRLEWQEVESSTSIEPAQQSCRAGADAAVGVVEHQQPPVAGERVHPASATSLERVVASDEQGTFDDRHARLNVLLINSKYQRRTGYCQVAGLRDNAGRSTAGAMTTDPLPYPHPQRQSGGRSAESHRARSWRARRAPEGETRG